MKNKTVKKMAGLLLSSALMLCVPNTVWAAAQAAFGSESYSPQAGESFPMGIYINADEVVSSGQIEVKYDPEMLEYVTGGTLAEDGLIRLTYVGTEANQVRQDIQFRPKAGGQTKVQIVKAEATGTGGNSLEITDMQTAPVHLPIADTCKLNSLMINGVAVNPAEIEQQVYHAESDGNRENADIQAVAPEGSTVTVSDTTLREGENTIAITVQDAAGNKAIYQMVITKQKIQESMQNNVQNPVQNHEQVTQTKVEEDNSLKNILLLVGGILILLELIIGSILAVRIYKRKQRRKRRTQQRNQARLKQQAAKGQNAGDEAMKAAALEIIRERQEKEKFLENKKDNGQSEEEEYEIKVENVTMTFRIIQNAPASVKEYMIKKLKKENKYREFSALKNVSFNVKKGEVVGIIGTNGSGKSTILKIISGALRPTSGQVRVDRRKIQLLTLGTGFDFELTGRENVYLNGAIIGYTKEYIDEKYEDIVKFAELEGFMDEKVKNYSSGMVSRLGFAIATMRDTPEILILDEVLSVGDMFFRKKSEARIKEMIHGGSTVLIVSHSMDVIKKNCDTVVWIEKGDLKMIGTPKEVCPAYEKMNG